MGDPADLTRPEILSGLLERHGIRLTRRLGQHFLTSRSALLRVADAAQPGPEDTVLEVGPGAGALTVELARRAGQVVAVELDRGLLPVLAETLASYPNVTLVQADALSVSLADLLPGDRPVKVAANIPYGITSPLLVRFLEFRPAFVSLTLMVQKEVADRLCAAPGTSDYGALSVFVRYHASVQRVGVVPRGAFFPPPKVDSAIVYLVPHAAPPVETPGAAAFFSVSRAAFGQRRKTLVNALTAGLDLPREKVRAALDVAGIDAGRRGETLSLEEFAAVSRALFAEGSEVDNPPCPAVG